jgi:hypothetical protein
VNVGWKRWLCLLQLLTLLGDMALLAACGWLLHALGWQALPFCALGFWAWHSTGGFEAWRN